MSFVHLHTHSHYSLLDGLAKIDELVNEAARLKMPALALTDYDHKALFGVQSNGGVNRLYSSVGAGSDTSTTPTITPNATTVEVTWEVRVSASRVVTVYVDGVEDALVTAAAITLTTAKTLVPHMIFVSTGAGVEQVNLATYECGLL